MSVATHTPLPVSLLRGEPPLGPLEHLYRQSSLKADVSQIVRIGWLLTLALVVYAGLNLPVDGGSPALIAVAVGRVLTIALCLGAIVALRRATSYAFADRLVVIWASSVAVFNLVVHAVYRASLPLTVLGDLVLIISFYVIFPSRLVFRLIPALLLSAGDLVLIGLFGRQLSPTDLNNIALNLLLGNLAGLIISVHLFTYRRSQFLAQHEIERLATLDGLTQVFNRRHFMALAAAEFQRARRYQRPFSLLLLDLDFFKQVNDTHGHAAGDAVLQAVARAVTALIRQSDSLGRLGGEEFAVLLPETAAPYALQLAERIRAACEQLRVPGPTAPITVTVSLGVTALHPADTAPEDTLRRADQALYYVKAHGRNAAHVLAG